MTSKKKNKSGSLITSFLEGEDRSNNFVSSFTVWNKLVIEKTLLYFFRLYTWQEGNNVLSFLPYLQNN